MQTVLFLFACWLLADFLSGVFHWVEDRYFRVEWPIIGKHIAEPNERHHYEPNAFLEGGYWYRNWTTIVPTLPLFFVTIPFTWWGIAFLFLTQANEVHAMSHRHQTGFIRMLQDTGILCSRRQHGHHHKAPYDCHYCVMSGFLNPFLDYIQLWQSLEWVLRWFGIETKEVSCEAR